MLEEEDTRRRIGWVPYLKNGHLLLDLHRHGGMGGGPSPSPYLMFFVAVTKQIIPQALRLSYACNL